MIPISFLAGNVSQLLATDTTTLANLSAPKVGLVKEPFLPGPDLLMAALTIAGLNGLDPIAAVAGSQLESVDPVNGNLLVEMKAPAGGWRWETGIGGSVPQTIYGVALFDNAAGTLYGAQLFSEPVILTAVNQTVVVDKVGFRIDTTKIT